MREIITIVLVIIGALIGAGFASGQEIYSFFYCYGKNGILGICVTSILMGILIYKVLKIVVYYKIEDYNDFLENLIKNKKATKAINIILNILLLVTFYIMIAGFGAYFEQEIGINRILGSLVLSVLCFIVFITSVEGVIKVSKYLVPILITFILIIGIMNITTLDIGNIEIIKVKRWWLLSAITYSSYNMILIIPMLISIKKHIKEEKNIKYISILSGLIMLILSIIVYTLLIKSDVDIQNLEMPSVYVIRKFFTSFRKIYAFIILASIFTTAITIGTGLLQNISKNKKSYTQYVLLMCITSIPISYFGFSNLVKIIYPIFGYIGIIQIISILSKKCCKNKRI